jgi:predicted nuclease of predicted toxin-antitoxin system
MGGKQRKSSKQSNSSPRKNQPHEELIFFIDRCLGKDAVAGALAAAGVNVRVHDDLYAQDTKDTTWLAEIGQKQWIMLTKDSKIKDNKLERDAVINAKAKLFTLTSKHMSGEDMAILFVKSINKIAKFALKQNHLLLLESLHPVRFQCGSIKRVKTN